MRLEFEATEVRDLGLMCPPGCAYCCLCPPGLLEDEVDGIVKACHGAAERLGKDLVGDCKQAICVQGGWGACAFLDDRRCTIYESRPHFCRQYPLLVYSGWRLQLTAIRSCRGLVPLGPRAAGNMGGEPPLRLLDILRHEVDLLGEGYFRSTLRETRASFEDLGSRKGIHATPEVVWRAAGRTASAVGRAIRMAKALDMRPGGGGGEAGARRSLLERSWDNISETFSSEEMIELPVFPMSDRSWMVFRMVGEDEVSGYRLKERGDLSYFGSLPVSEIGLRDMTDGARKVLRDYLSIAFGRDIFYGIVAREALLEERPMDGMAVEVSSRVAVDLWWRAGLLAAVGGKLGQNGGAKGRPGKIDVKAARDAIVFMDADMLDSHALGAII